MCMARERERERARGRETETFSFLVFLPAFFRGGVKFVLFDNKKGKKKRKQNLSLSGIPLSLSFPNSFPLTLSPHKFQGRNELKAGSGSCFALHRKQKKSPTTPLFFFVRSLLFFLCCFSLCSPFHSLSLSLSKHSSKSVQTKKVGDNGLGEYCKVQCFFF